MRPRLLLAVALVACAKPYFPVRQDAPAGPVAPPGVRHATETFAGEGGVPLFAQSWRPDGESRAALVVMHGLRDHSDRYAGLAARAVARGIAVYAFDLRGHGRSSGRRVTVDAFDDYVADLDRFVALVREREPGRPVFAFGHSMGGAIVTLWAETRQPAIGGVILSAPAIRIDLPPLAAAVTRLSGTLTPNFGGLASSNEGFSTDPAVEADMGKDPLIFQPPGPIATAAELVGAIERIWAGVDRLTAPLLCLHGTADTLTAPAGCRELVERAAATDKTLRLYDGQAHDLVHEPRRDEVIADVAAWIEAHAGGPPANLPAPDPGRRLGGDGGKPSIAVALEGSYRGTTTDFSGQWGGAALRARVLLGGRFAWPLALDAEIFGGYQLNFRFAAYPIGIALVHARGHNVSLAAGAGVSSAGDGAAFEIPVALDAEAQLGPLRFLFWGRIAWLPGDEGRQDGTDVPFADELHVGLAVRLGRNHRYWADANAGVGPYLGVTFDQRSGANILGVVLGLHLWGGS